MAYASKLTVQGTTYDIRDITSVHSVTSVPTGPVTGDTIVWAGLTAGNWKQGGIYRFDGTGWVLILAQDDNLLHLKGAVAAVEDLPTTGVKLGDTWLVGADGEDKSEYTAVAVDPSIVWERLGNVGEVDLTEYAKTEHVDALIKKFKVVANTDGNDTYTLQIPVEFKNDEADE